MAPETSRFYEERREVRRLLDDTEAELEDARTVVRLDPDGQLGQLCLVAALLGSGSEDCLTAGGQDASTLVNPEPGFFILGSKSYGRNNTFLLRSGWQQVDDALGLLLGDAR